MVKNDKFTTPLGMIGHHLEIPAIRHQDSAALGVKPVSLPSSFAYFGSIYLPRTNPNLPQNVFNRLLVLVLLSGVRLSSLPSRDLRQSLPYKRSPHLLEVSRDVRSVKQVYWGVLAVTPSIWVTQGCSELLTQFELLRVVRSYSLVAHLLLSCSELLPQFE